MTVPSQPVSKFQSPLAVRRRRTRRFERGGKCLLVSEEGPGWIILDGPGLRAFDSLLVDRFGMPSESVLSSDDWSEFLSTLAHHGLIAIEGEIAGSRGANEAPEDDIRLHVITLRITHGCNLRCVYCYSASGEESRAFSLEAVLRSLDIAFDVAATRIHILLTGGEPLLDMRRLRRVVAEVEALARLKGKTITWGLQTNGTLIDEERIAQLRRLGISTGVSLDGPRAIHDSQRPMATRDGSFDKVVNGIRMLVRNGLDTGVLLTLTSRSTGMLPDTLQLLQEMGVQSAKMSLFAPLGTGAGIRDQVPDGTKIFEAFRGALDCIDDGRIRDLVFADVLYFFTALATDRRANMCLRAPCGAARNTISVDCNGHLYPCDCLVADSSFDLGLPGPSFPDLLLQGRASELRSRRIETLEPCRGCAWSPYCGGTCAAEAYAATGDTRSVFAALCTFHGLAFEEMMWRLALRTPLRDYCEHHFGRKRLGLSWQ